MSTYVSLRANLPEGVYGEVVKVDDDRAGLLISKGRAVPADAASARTDQEGTPFSDDVAAAVSASSEGDTPVDDGPLDYEEG